MGNEAVKLKGGRNGISLVFDKQADYASIEKDIRSKLLSGADFFRCGATILIRTGDLPPEDEARLIKLFHQYGVIVRRVEEETEKPPDIKPAFVPKAEAPGAAPVRPAVSGPAGAPVSGMVQEMTVIDYTVRGGQEITAKGSVLICGNVNPGAHIIAGGSVDIRGTCRGLVHAGAFGDTSAFIIADHLMPVQIRIANYIAQAPDKLMKPNCAEKASIKDGQIIIEPIER